MIELVPYIHIHTLSFPFTYIFAVITVPAAPRSCNITLFYDQSSRKLKFINTIWDSMPVSNIMVK